MGASPLATPGLSLLRPRAALGRPMPPPSAASQTPAAAAPGEPTRLRDLSPQQWKSGIAAWLGWLFDGLELHLYTLIATPLVVQLLAAPSSADPQVKEKSAYIQAAFLIGWAVGGAFFGRLGDLIGRSRALALTVLTYASCTGLCAFAQTWWQLMFFRFVAALGIGGEWAVGASLLVETWPRAWRPWGSAASGPSVRRSCRKRGRVAGDRGSRRCFNRR